MARGRPISIVFYAINGRGLGHLTRLLAIARAARQLLEALDVPADLEIVTTSEGSSIADDFPVYKLPSKTAITRSGTARDRYQQRAKLIVSNLVAAQSPDLLVLDTVPYGAFQEFSFLRSYARATAYIYRHQDPRSASSELVQRHLELFDRIVVPDDETAAGDYPVPRSARPKLSFVGGVHGFDAATSWERDRVRRYFGVGDAQRLVYVAAGGGGDGRDWLGALVRAVAEDPKSFVIAGYGPLHRGECVHASNVVALLEGNVSRYFRGVDAAISAAGYNSYEELLAARVPTLFFSQAKGMDQQDRRIAQGAAAGLHGEIAENADPVLVRGRLEDLLEGDEGRRIRSALAARPAPVGALRAAVELLSVCANESSSLDRNALIEVASWRRDLDATEGDFVSGARAYRRWRSFAASPPEIALERDAAAARWWSGRGAADDAVARGTELVDLRTRAEIDDAGWRSLVQAFAASTTSKGHRDKLGELLEALRIAGPALATSCRDRSGTDLRAAVSELVRAREDLLAEATN